MLKSFKEFLDLTLHHFIDQDMEHLQERAAILKEIERGLENWLDLKDEAGASIFEKTLAKVKETLATMN